MNAGSLLRLWRERALLTQQQLARRAGVSARTIRRLEVDASIRPQGSTLGLVAAALDLSVVEREELASAVKGLPFSGVGGGSAESGVSAVAGLRQLPAAAPAFTGRASELADLVELPDASAVVVGVIDGMAGIGKTALAVHAAHRLAGRFRDGQLFLDLHGYTDGVAPVDAADALGRLLRALGVPGGEIPEFLDDRAALYRSRLAGRRVLVVLDDAVSEAQVEPLLPGAAGCLVLVTSRRRLAGLDAAHVVSLEVLARVDAIALFCCVVGERRLAGESREGVERVVELCGRSPMAIRIAAARLRSRPTWTVQHLIEGLVDPAPRTQVESPVHRIEPVHGTTNLCTSRRCQPMFCSCSTVC